MTHQHDDGDSEKKVHYAWTVGSFIRGDVEDDISKRKFTFGACA